MEGAMNADEKDDADTIVADSLVLSYLIAHKYSGKLMLLNMELAQALGAMAICKNSPLRNPLNIALLQGIRMSEWRSAIRDYLYVDHRSFP
jgi:ABC-type amino acid transport substrate-binding protein